MNNETGLETETGLENFGLGLGLGLEGSGLVNIPVFITFQHYHVTERLVTV